MSQTDSRRLPRGRHNLTREQVQTDQRIRLVTGVAEAVGKSGYTNTSVASIIRNAGVSRETFYQLYDSKLDCYLDAFDFMAGVLLEHLRGVATSIGTPLERFDQALSAYLGSVAAEPTFARLFLVESFAAGAEAIERRSSVQNEFASAMAGLLELGSDDQQGHLACRLFIAGVSTLMTAPLLDGDTEAILSLKGPLMAEARRRFAEIG